MSDYIGTHILPDLPEQINFNIKKVDLIYFATSWKEVSGPLLLSQSAKGIQLLVELLTYLWVKSKKSANFFLILEILQEVTDSNTREIQSSEQLIKKQKLSIKNKKPDSPSRKIKNKLNKYIYLPDSIKADQSLDSIINNDIVSSLEINKSLFIFFVCINTDIKFK